MQLNVISSEKAQTVESIYTQDVLGNEFRVYGDLENPIFIAKDVADWIEHKDVTSMIRNIDEDEKLIRLISGRKYNFLTEDGLYEVLMQSRKPIAKQFKKQVKHILKQIRQTGGYIPHSEENDDLTIMAKALQISQKTIEKKNAHIKLAEEENIKLSRVIDGYKPKVEYVDEILSCDNALLTTNKHLIMDYQHKH